MRQIGRNAHHAMPQEESFKVGALRVMDLGGYIAESKPHNQSIQPIATLRLIFRYT
jgi:hypothetical protein